MRHRETRGGLEVCLAADIGGEDGGGRATFKGGDLVFQQSSRKARLEDRIGAGRPAAEMCLRHIGQRIAEIREQFFHLPFEFQAVLKRAGGVEGYALTSDEG